jgi:hypothetical protein
MRQKVLESAANKFRKKAKTSELKDTMKDLEGICASCRSFVSLSKAVGEGESPKKAEHTLEVMLATLCAGETTEENKKFMSSRCHNAKEIIHEDAAAGGTFTEPTDRTKTCESLGFCATPEFLVKLLTDAKSQFNQSTEEILQGDPEEIVSLMQMTEKEISLPGGWGGWYKKGLYKKPRLNSPPRSYRSYRCFPASSVVQMETGSKRMEELSVGDRVLTVDGRGKMTYSPVYMFGHAERDTIAEYVNVQTEAGVMKLSPLHFIPTNGFNYKYARDLQVGETVLQYAEKTGQFVSAEVTKLSQSFESGVYNPHTLNGKIVVDGVVASCYSNWVLDNLFPVSSLHSVYEVVFTPHKLLSVSLGYFGLDQKLAEVAGVSNPTAPTVVDPMSIQTFASFGVSLALPILVAGVLFTVAKK